MVWLNSREAMHGVQQTVIRSYVPKCLGHTSTSEILQGDRPEDFASDCWLQGHLHQFGNDLSQPIPGVMSQDDEALTDSSTDISYSDISDDVSSHSENNSVDSFSSDDEFMCPSHMLHYHMMMMPDPPPYTSIDDDEPPPTYEEAIAQSDRRSNNSIRSSELAFMF